MRSPSVTWCLTISYSYGVNRYHDRTTNEDFDGDFDQRHTFNAYGLYRITNRFSLAGKVRGNRRIVGAGVAERGQREPPPRLHRQAARAF